MTHVTRLSQLANRERPVFMQFVKFASIGVINTIAGLSIITGGMYFLKLSPLSANAIGYSICIGLSFVLNGRVTFGQRSLSSGMFFRFLAVSAAAYIANIVVFALSVRYNAYLAQVLGMIAYTLVNFIGCRTFAFVAANRRIKAA
jgi:putative flippase GtrA